MGAAAGIERCANEELALENVKVKIVFDQNVINATS